jgi:quinol monooxygenase YgiN
MSPEDISILGYFTIKEGREEDCLKLMKELMESTWAEDEGCICYYFYLKPDSQRELVFHERWRDRDALQAHVKRLLSVYGPPKGGGPGLPEAILEPLEKVEFVSLKAIA